MTDKSDWLAGLKVGDPVVTRSSHFSDDFGRLDKIVRITPKQFVSERGLRYRRTNGDRIGNSDSHYSAWIEEPTVEREVAMAADRKHRKLRYSIDQVRWQDHHLATLEAVLAVLTEAGKAKR